MSNEIDNGGSAFACAAENGHQAGMSLRDYYAGQALQGIMNSEDLRNRAVRKDVTVRPEDCFAHNAYLVADAMIKARGKS